jgi:hypothetical protein
MFPWTGLAVADLALHDEQVQFRGSGDDGTRTHDPLLAKQVL